MGLRRLHPGVHDDALAEWSIPARSRSRSSMSGNPTGTVDDHIGGVDSTVAGHHPEFTSPPARWQKSAPRYGYRFPRLSRQPSAVIPSRLSKGPRGRDAASRMVVCREGPSPKRATKWANSKEMNPPPIKTKRPGSDGSSRNRSLVIACSMPSMGRGMGRAPLAMTKNRADILRAADIQRFFVQETGRAGDDVDAGLFKTFQGIARHGGCKFVLLPQEIGPGDTAGRTGCLCLSGDAIWR